MPGKKPELLAPAGNWESLVAAVENGADAVYLGGRLFNARLSAGNFDNDEIVRAVEFAHVRGVKVYVTVNILLDDRELPGAAKFLHFLQQCGADAAIVQDLGLARLARQVIPELPLHASTQMTVHNLPAALLLKEAGIGRVILARELSLERVKEMVRVSGLEIEVFVHGALCVCYSGQCLMSSLIGGRSGNRGRCAQPCRLQYALVDRRGRLLVDPGEAGEYLLSTCDLNLSEHLPVLIEAGIASFKIEGRMKRPEYVATVVRIYRELIDRAAAGGSFAVRPEEARDLAQIFNRGFTAGYFFGRPGRALMSYRRPNNRGIRLGRVRSFDRKSRLAEILLEEPLRLGDGIEVWVSEGGRIAGTVGRILLDGRSVERAPAGACVQLDITGRVFPGDRVFKTHDAELVERARASFASPREQRKIPVFFTVSARPGEPMRIKVEDSEGFAGEAETALPAQTAVNRPLTREYLEKQLDRLGNTPFAMAGLNCDLAGEVMVPVSEINEARRTALARLMERRAASFRRKPVPEDVFGRRLAGALAREAGKGPGVVRPVLAVAVTDLPSLKAAVRAGADEVYFGGEYYRSKGPVTLDDIYAAGEICAEAGARFILSAPRVQQDGELDRYCRLLEKAAARYLDGVLAGNLGLIKRAREIAGKPVYADFPLNVFNFEAACFLAEAGVSRVTLSPELTMEQIKRMVPFLPVPAEVIVHGELPLMVSEYCAVGSLLGGGRVEGCTGPCRSRACGLRDRKGVVFPVELDQDCRMHVFNSRDLCAIEEAGELAGAGIEALRIEARRNQAEYVRDTVRAYRLAIDALPEGLKEDRLAELKEPLARYSPGGFTKGHYYRGVL
ncbi:collagenase and related proteases [Pelotomaculum thermopropionicum SI]|uniref:Collagenase and related proteases n=1 Tax=Pelotomaculum thermopropionicum (strain DSM 13744 / JCM 10971 / SI) TaxID=370438 RepID=A5D0X1_PELTS|nr:collagenase and related proteases [Pelotomaculum thermopropionicum SI]